jgi:hypothetical protein
MTEEGQSERQEPKTSLRKRANVKSRSARRRDGLRAHNGWSGGHRRDQRNRSNITKSFYAADAR